MASAPVRPIAIGIGFTDLSVKAALTSSGWELLEVANVGSALDQIHRCPSLILLELAEATALRKHEIAELRAAGGLAASVPILGLMPEDTMLPGRSDNGFDGYISAGPSCAEQLDRWKRHDEMATVARLEAVFGRAEIRAILLRFRGFLETALDALDRGEAHTIAHRVAGMAGTVGFSAVGREWSLVSDDGGFDADGLYRHTRVAIATIDTILLSSPEVPD